jgi:hypothetical protein
MTQPITTRRALLGCAGLASVALLTPAAASVIPYKAERLGQADWDALVAEYRRCYAATDAVVTIADEARSEYYESKPITPVFTIDTEGDYGRFGKHVLPITILHDDLDDPTKGWKDPEQIAGFRARLAEYRAADADARAKCRVDEIKEAVTAAYAAQAAAFARIMAHQPLDLGMLAEKIAILTPDDGEDNKVFAAILGDVHALAQMEG